MTDIDFFFFCIFICTHNDKTNHSKKGQEEVKNIRSTVKLQGKG